MIKKYLVVREDKESGQIYVNGEENTLFDAVMWIEDDKNFNCESMKYEIYRKVEKSEIEDV